MILMVPGGVIKKLVVATPFILMNWGLVSVGSLKIMGFGSGAEQNKTMENKTWPQRFLGGHKPRQCIFT